MEACRTAIAVPIYCSRPMIQVRVVTGQNLVVPAMNRGQMSEFAAAEGGGALTEIETSAEGDTAWVERWKGTLAQISLMFS